MWAIDTTFVDEGILPNIDMEYDYLYEEDRISEGYDHLDIDELTRNDIDMY